MDKAIRTMALGIILIMGSVIASAIFIFTIENIILEWIIPLFVFCPLFVYGLMCIGKAQYLAEEAGRVVIK